MGYPLVFSTIIFLFLAKGGHVKFEALVKYSMADSSVSLPLLLPLGAGGGVKTCYPTVPLRLTPDYSTVAHRVLSEKSALTIPFSRHTDVDADTVSGLKRQNGSDFQL